jgi:16S rRNA (guanine1207-N2)-methyltransferase
MELDPTRALLLEHSHPCVDDRILVLEGGDGRLAHAIADKYPEVEILTLSRDAREFWAAKNLLDSHPTTSVGEDVLPTTGDWDIVLLTIPKERRYARTLLLSAWDALKPGGLLLLSGPTRKGAKAVIKDAARLFGGTNVLGYRRHQRIAAAIRGDHLPNPLPNEFQQNGIAPGTIHTIEVVQSLGSLVMETHPGIFSWENIDEGTTLLLDHLNFQPGIRVWDVGCGCGVIGLSAALAGADFVIMSDVNLICIDYAKRNAVRNGLDHRVNVLPADGLVLPTDFTFSKNPDLSLQFDLIVSNPAFHRGHQVNKSMADRLISQAPLHLAPGGQLVIIANRFLNYHRSMQQYFKRVTRLAEDNKYHLLLGSNE